MAESIVSLVVETLGSLIKDEVVLLKNFHKELEFIKDEFRRIQACLKDADTKGEMKGGEQVKVWLQQLRHVAFDIEDLLEEYLFQYHEQHLHVRGYGTCGFIYRIKNFLHKYLCQRHKLARQIKDIKCRLEDISKGKEKYNFDDSEASTSSAIRRKSRNPQHDALLLGDDKVVGINENKKELITRLITGETSLGVSCVHGQGGVGKTTLVKKVYENQQIKSHFSICGWIVVSQSYDSNRLLKELILAPLNEEKKKKKISQLEDMEAWKLKQELHNYYQGRRYLVVMDDIWDHDAWNEIKSALPDSRCGSQIIVTTRSERIANYCQENSGVVFKLEPLSEDDSLSLFQKMAAKSDVLKSNCSSIDQHTKEVILNFLHKCGGLPLAIVAIAGLLSTKHTIVEWERIYTDNGSLLSHPELGDVNIILSLSYNDLQCHLKSCLLYLCMFPEDHLISCSSLLQLWAAEGFCESNRDDITKEDKAEGYLDELIARSLIQVQRNDYFSRRPSKCRIHDLLRDFILKKARDQEFAECLRGDETNSGRLRRGDETNSDRLRRVSFSNAKLIKANPVIAHNTLSCSLRQIRSLLMFGSDITASTVSTIICGGGIKLMKVLHLEAPLAEFPGEDVTANLNFLRYLRLDLNDLRLDLEKKELTSLPSYLGKLVYLETLHLNVRYRYGDCVELPDEILKLTRLRNLICNYSFVLPKEIGRLSALENLCPVDGSRGIDGAELGKLTRLRSLKILGLREEDATAVLASVEKMKHLRLLSIVNSGYSNSIISFEEKCPPPRPMLQYLRLYARMKGGTLTDWICSLERLQSLDLDGCKITEESFFEGLQLRLTNLVTLHLQSDAIEVEEWCFQKGCFPKLRSLNLFRLSKLKLIKVEEGAMPCIQTLRFSNCENLKLIKVEEGAMPCIQSIRFDDCEKLKNVPTGIEHLTTLKEISLFNMSKHFEMAIRSHRWKAGHLPAIVVSRTRVYPDTDTDAEEENANNSDEDIVHNQEGDQETIIHDDDDIVQI